MTYREYVTMFHPKCVGDEFVCGVQNCPGSKQYGFSSAPEAGDNACNIWGDDELDFKVCWNQEIPKSVLIEKINEKFKEGRITMNQAREICGFEPLSEPTEIINKEEINMPNKTREQLFDEINQKAAEISDLKKELEKLEKYKEYEKAGDEIYAIMKAFMDSGFTREEAFTLITTSMRVFSR